VLVVNPTTQDFETKLMGIFHHAQDKRASSVVVISGDLHRVVGGSINRGGHRMPICCDVMKRLMKEGDKILHEPLKGKGATLKIQYFLPRYDLK
jgi:5-methylcytosine-specific restriction protein A